MPASPEQQFEILARRAAEIVPEDDFRVALGRPLRVKLGLDPTAPHVTLGWAVVLRQLRRFQDLGHTAVLIVGDFTARIGDPSAQSTTRRMLDRDEVEACVSNVLEQFRLILSDERLEIRRNSEWLEALDIAGLLRLASHYTVARMLERDDFANRYAQGAPISVTEFLYPLLQAYDSVAVEADVELGGTDQHFNLMAGRVIQRAYGQEPQCVMTTPLLEGTDGLRKMSQSWGNYIAVTEPPDDMFGKLMRVPDPLMDKYALLCTDLDPSELQGAPPQDAKRRLAQEVVRIYHGDERARAARSRFDEVIRDHRIPGDVPEIDIPDDCVLDGLVNVPKLLKAADLASSSSDGRRALEQGGVRLDGDVLNEESVKPEQLHGHVLQRGPRKFVRLR
jgi:tyrosyl-tRNA synthetase